MKKKWCGLMVAAVTLAGCAGTPVAKEAARAINGYCAAMSKEERALIRAEVAAAIAPNAIQITCAGDQP